MQPGNPDIEKAFDPATHQFGNESRLLGYRQICRPRRDYTDRTDKHRPLLRSFGRDHHRPGLRMIFSPGS